MRRSRLWIIGTALSPTLGQLATAQPSSADVPSACLREVWEQPVGKDDVVFDAGRSSAPDGDQLICRWDFRDVQLVESAGHSAAHRYARSGRYVVSLAVDDDLGGTATGLLHATAGVTACEMMMVGGLGVRRPAVAHHVPRHMSSDPQPGHERAA